MSTAATALFPFNIWFPQKCDWDVHLSLPMGLVFTSFWFQVCLCFDIKGEQIATVKVRRRNKYRFMGWNWKWVVDPWTGEVCLFDQGRNLVVVRGFRLFFYEFHCKKHWDGDYACEFYMSHCMIMDGVGSDAEVMDFRTCRNDWNSWTVQSHAPTHTLVGAWIVQDTVEGGWDLYSMSQTFKRLRVR
jgi:hypothetical protein